MTKDETTKDQAIFVLFGFPAIVGASMVWRGYVLSVLWAWFMVPYLAAPRISLPVAVGVSIIAGFLTTSIWPQSHQDTGMVKAVGVAVVGPAMVLLIGWIVTKFL